MEYMRILVTTPTGNIGRRVLAELLAPEFSVRVVARDPARLPQKIQAQVEVVHGSTDDAAALRRALDGVEALFWSVPGAPLGEVNAQAHYERFAMAGYRAIRKAGTPRVVTISAAGNVSTRDAGPLSGLRAMEEILNQSGAAIRHLRCGWFTETFPRQERSICGQGLFWNSIPTQVAASTVALNEIADVALRWLVRRDWAGIESVRVYVPGDVCFNQASFVTGGTLESQVWYTEPSAHNRGNAFPECWACGEI